MGHYQGGAVGGLDHFGHGVSLARASYAQQDLVLFSFEHTAGELFDGLALVAGRLVVAGEFEIHKSSSW